jgi:hypothetical protein
VDFEQFCEVRGFDPGGLTESQRGTLLTAWKAAESEPPQTDAEREFRLRELRASRPSAYPFAVGGGGAPVVADVLACALSRSLGVPADAAAKQWGERAADLAESREFRGMSLHGVMRGLLAAAGEPVPARITEPAIRAALAVDLRAAGGWGPSTQGASFSAIVGAAVNKRLLDSFRAVPVTWRAIARRGSLPDFKQGSAVRMTVKGALAKVPPGGEIQHGQLDAESATNTLDTYGRIIGLDRRDLINDDAGALTQVVPQLATKAAKSLERAFYTVFLNNSSFFTAGRGNTSTGAGSALALAGLSAAIQKMRSLKDVDGEFALVEPKILLVPPTLEPAARQLVNSMQLIGGPTTPAPSANPWADLNLQVVTSPLMEDTSLTGNNTAAWYLLAGPGDTAVMQVDFLDGLESPTVEATDADFSMLGQAFRVFWDYGCSFLEYRGGVRSAGS